MLLVCHLGGRVIIVHCLFRPQRVAISPVFQILARSIIFAALLALQAAPAMAQQRNLLVWGDSLSAAYGIREEQGWVELLSGRMAREFPAWRVINGSVSGETTTGGRERLPAMLAEYRPELVILELGGNDGLRGIPVESIRENLAAMIRLIKAEGGRVLLAGIRIPPNYGPRYTQPFQQNYFSLAEEHELPLLPFLIESIPENPELMQDDGIHPVAEAQPIILENVWTVLEPILIEMGN